MNTSLRASVLLGLLMLSSRPGMAESICDQNQLSTCSQKLDDISCLELFHACGRYDDIVEKYQADPLKDRTAMYYTGMSLLGMSHRTRIKSLICEYVQDSKSILTKYIAETKSTKGFRDPQEFRQVYRASKALEEMNSVVGCLEEGYTAHDARVAAQNYADELARKLFIRASTGTGLDDEVATIKQSIQDTIRGVSSQAAEIENQLSMRRLALEASDRTLKGLVEIFEANFGTSKPTYNDRKYLTSVTLEVDEQNSRFADARKQSQALITSARDREKKISEALGGVSAEQYQSAKLSLITRASDEVNLSAETYSSGDRLISRTGAGQELYGLYTKLQEAAAADKSLETHINLKQDWSPVLGVDCATKVNHWACQNPEGAIP